MVSVVVGGGVVIRVWGGHRGVGWSSGYGVVIGVWGGRRGVGWSSGCGVIVVVVGHEGVGRCRCHVVVVRQLLLLLWVRHLHSWNSLGSILNVHHGLKYLLSKSAGNIVKT
jgi:hypothetical protein